MNVQTKQSIGWIEVVLGILVAINVAAGWPIGLLYLWAILVLLVGIWELAARP